MEIIGQAETATIIPKMIASATKALLVSLVI